VGIVGPNGAGKTTLVKASYRVPPAGFWLGPARLAIELVALDQRRENLDPNDTLAEAMTEGRGDTITVGPRRGTSSAT
jgi:ATP-binding cassette subfamily F protein uup